MLLQFKLKARVGILLERIKRVALTIRCLLAIVVVKQGASSLLLSAGYILTTTSSPARIDGDVSSFSVLSKW